MEYSFYDFLKLIGSLGLFLYGMKIMSEGLQKVAGDRLRSILTGNDYQSGNGSFNRSVDNSSYPVFFSNDSDGRKFRKRRIAHTCRIHQRHYGC